MTTSQATSSARDARKGIQRSPTVVKFASHIRNRLGEPCMATQDAIDRITHSYGGRAEFLNLLCSAEYVRRSLYGSIAEGQWAQRDIQLATGLSPDYWLGMIEGESRVQP